MPPGLRAAVLGLVPGEEARGFPPASVCAALLNGQERPGPVVCSRGGRAQFCHLPGPSLVGAPHWLLPGLLEASEGGHHGAGAATTPGITLRVMEIANIPRGLPEC